MTTYLSPLLPSSPSASTASLGCLSGFYATNSSRYRSILIYAPLFTAFAVQLWCKTRLSSFLVPFSAQKISSTFFLLFFYFCFFASLNPIPALIHDLLSQSTVLSHFYACSMPLAYSLPVKKRRQVERHWWLPPFKQGLSKIGVTTKNETALPRTALITPTFQAGTQ